ncbi:MAG TPA: hypothetical protein VGN93_23900 [Shinella sp.]|jgi:hypothetical protein|uniref:hypothetical protein n=1 Tax=Shinella sp. TaxID=1870904 RepID=UPI002E10C7F7|nr:hypothetical protein [Shinella sp.]
MLKLRAIGQDGLDAASELLTKGFPSRSLAFWQHGLKRLFDHGSETGAGSIGNLLMADETPIGILLTIARRDGETGQKIVNLSSWYVEESHRWFAPRMLLAAMADNSAVYTDLTPSKAAVELNNRLGFRTFDYDLLLFPLPWLAIAGRRQGRLMALDAMPPGAIAGSLLRDLQNHQALGCIVTVIEAGGRYHPVVFDVIRKKHIPIARVVYAESADLVADNLAILARLLIRHGVPLLCLQMPTGRRVPFAYRWQSGLRYQVKGEWDDGSINELYSERVLLKV